MAKSPPEHTASKPSSTQAASAGAGPTAETDLSRVHRILGNRLIGQILGGGSDDGGGPRPDLHPFLRGAGGRHPSMAALWSAIGAGGLTGPSQRLPHGDLVQASFGTHDISDIAAHVGGPAAAAGQAMGAVAYATGSSVAFCEAPDVFTVAHEVTHCLQQRNGVQLEGGVGAEGDPHEQQADEVAREVAAGRSAEGLLTRLVGPPGSMVRASQPVVQLRRRRKRRESSPPGAAQPTPAAQTTAAPTPEEQAALEQGAFAEAQRIFDPRYGTDLLVINERPILRLQLPRSDPRTQVLQDALKVILAAPQASRFVYDAHLRRALGPISVYVDDDPTRPNEQFNTSHGNDEEEDEQPTYPSIHLNVKKDIEVIKTRPPELQNLPILPPGVDPDSAEYYNAVLRATFAHEITHFFQVNVQPEYRFFDASKAQERERVGQLNERFPLLIENLILALDRAPLRNIN